MFDSVALVMKAGVHSATPILFVALGEMIAERSGVLNLGLEGLMIVGALSGFFFGFATGSIAFGIFMAVLITGAFSLIHAFITLTLKANQVVSGLSITFLGLGLASFMGRSFINKTAPFLRDEPVPFLSGIPFFGKIIFDQNILVYISLLAIPALWFFLYRTKSGLKLQVCGESPVTADSAGINVIFYRYASVFFGGVMAGIGGAFLTLADASSWMDGMTSGRGWIAVAIVIFGNWDPVKILAGSYIFGSLTAMQFRLQAYGVTIPPSILEMSPYFFTLVVLILTSFRRFSKKSPFISNGKKGDRPNSGAISGSPTALGTNYERETRD
jgi:simple sugar transport system permease protein